MLDLNKLPKWLSILCDIQIITILLIPVLFISTVWFDGFYQIIALKVLCTNSIIGIALLLLCRGCIYEGYSDSDKVKKKYSIDE